MFYSYSLFHAMWFGFRHSIEAGKRNTRWVSYRKKFPKIQAYKFVFFALSLTCLSTLVFVDWVGKQVQSKFFTLVRKRKISNGPGTLSEKKNWGGVEVVRQWKRHFDRCVANWTSALLGNRALSVLPVYKDSSSCFIVLGGDCFARSGRGGICLELVHS